MQKQVEPTYSYTHQEATAQFVDTLHHNHLLPNKEQKHDDVMYIHIWTHLKLNVAPLASPARSLDLEHRLSTGILDGEPRVDQTEILLHVAHHRARWTLNLNLLEAAEEAAGLAAQGTLYVDDLQPQTQLSDSHLRTIFQGYVRIVYTYVCQLMLVELVLHVRLCLCVFNYVGWSPWKTSLLSSPCLLSSW